MTSRILVVGLFLLLAGCGSKGTAPSPSSAVAPGAVEGRVLDEALQPLAGARVQVLLSEFNATTGADGAFEIPNVPAGPQRLVASLDGYSSQTQTLVVPSGGVIAAEFQLFATKRVVPYNRTLTFSGLLLCGLPQDVSCDVENAQSNATFHFEVEPSLRGFVVELQWVAAAPAANQRLGVEVLAASPQACGHEYAEAEGTSVLRLRVLAGHPESGGHQCIQVRGTGDDPVARQDFDVFVTLFFHEPPPEGFTAVR